MNTLYESIKNVKDYCRSCEKGCPRDCEFYDKIGDNCTMDNTNPEDWESFMCDLCHSAISKELIEDCARIAEYCKKHEPNCISAFCKLFDEEDVSCILIDKPCYWDMEFIKNKLCNGIDIIVKDFEKIKESCKRSEKGCPNDCIFYDASSELCAFGDIIPKLWGVTMRMWGLPAPKEFAKSLNIVIDECGKHPLYQCCDFNNDEDCTCVFMHYPNEWDIGEIRNRLENLWRDYKCTN